MVGRRIRALVLVAAVLAAVFPYPPAAVAARADQWRALAVEALERFETTDDVGDEGDAGGDLKVMTYGLAFEASGRLRGFADPRTLRYRDKVLSMKNPDGGYGLPFAYDVLGDGTVNPATTTYTVTLADHVGEPFLLGFQRGAVPRAELQNIVNLIFSTGRINTAQGACIAYSRSANDLAPYACIHNVNSGAGLFLMRASAAGVGRTGLAALVADITRREVYSYVPAAGNWHYADTTMFNDPDHLSYIAWSMYELAPVLGSNVAYAMAHTDYRPGDGLHQSAVVHARLAGLPATIGHIPAAAGSEARFCEYGDRWLPEVAEYVDTADPGGAAQIAQLTARTADACD